MFFDFNKESSPKIRELDEEVYQLLLTEADKRKFYSEHEFNPLSKKEWYNTHYSL